MSTFPPADLPARGATRLTDWGVIRAVGDEAGKFLHGQLTQDIQNLPSKQARLAGYCTAKGRLLASFVTWQATPGEWLMACSADVLPSVLKRLGMFVMRARCKLSDASADWPLWGLAGTEWGAADLADLPQQPWTLSQSEGATLIRLPAAQVGGKAVHRVLWAGAQPPNASELEVETWRAIEAHSGVARIVAATSEQFVPQMVNLELVGGVEFQKGCYPGQEIVARSQYRGTIKRRSFVVACAEPLAPGQEVFHDADPEQPAGLVVLAGRWREGHHAALVELKLSALEGGQLHLLRADGPTLQMLEQPYALPTEPA